MRLILEFLKPHWRLCAVTMALSLLDAGGALLIPTLVSDLINGATGGAIGFDGLLRTGVWMVVVATVSGIAAIAGGWVCAVLTARVGRDLREAVYRKSLTLSVSDFRAFGVSSFTTRTTSDVSNIRFALLNFFQLVVPVPVAFAFALALAFGKDWVLGALLAAVLAVICALSVPIVRQAAGIFRLLQKQLDRIATVLLENITGVRVVRAFDKSAHEEARMEATFEDYRATGVQTVRLFAFMDGYLFSAINLFILAVLAVSGFRIEAGRFAPGD
ncbi:MAG TPA: ABC transporter ATP-binding protein, partial [Candidatus Spyradenecus faecavium]|nr:ABC transporter ATP-binding protein [Candidatus Spyradenecus faecavium]